MPKIAYIHKRFGPDARLRIESANTIMLEYAAQGFELTLRQLFYQFVSRNIIKNTPQEYKRLGELVNDARLAGLIDWNHIIDRTRYVRARGHWDTPASIIESASFAYAIDKWKEQHHYVEVWIEKDALVGVIESVCSSNDVPYLSCRGYASQSEMWLTAQRLITREKDGRKPIILYLGDHDPSGVHMSKNVEERLRMFGCFITRVERLALLWEQITLYNPPPNTAKTTDSRHESYRRKFGTQCWELDALEPRVIEDLVSKAIRGYRDETAWKRAEKQEESGRKLLKRCADRWPAVETFLSNK